VVYNRRTNQVCNLSPVAVQVLDCCDGQTTFEAAQQRIQQLMGSDSQRAIELVEASLFELNQLGVFAEEAGVGRRKFLAASLASSALIVSITLPSPALASSCQRGTVCDIFASNCGQPGCNDDCSQICADVVLDRNGFPLSTGGVCIAASDFSSVLAPNRGVCCLSTGQEANWNNQPDTLIDAVSGATNDFEREAFMAGLCCFGSCVKSGSGPVFSYTCL